jgi:eukaryotic-like serine/threonine-protein kinase
MHAPEGWSASDFDGTTEAVGPNERFRSIGPYRLFQMLGTGGMGEVWLAEQTKPVHRLVAVKVIKPGMDYRHIVSRFEAERQALALMLHPAIAAVFDGGATTEGDPYFVMEYVKGEPITAYCDRHRLGMRDRLALFLQMCEGVQHAHQKGVIHRDLKPSNVLVTVIDDRPLPKIIDFGVAKAMAQPLVDRTLFTELGVLVGTREYMSPEQAEGGLDLDTRTDVYALGVILYELLTGALPLDAALLRQAGSEEIVRLIREKDPPIPSTRVTRGGEGTSVAARNRDTEPARLARLLRGDLDWITMKALEKDRMRRYASVSDFAADIRRHLRHEPVMAGPPSTTYRLQKFVRRHPGGISVGVTALMLLLVFGIVMAVQARRIAAERDIASRERDRATRVSGFLVSLFQASDPNRAKGETLTALDLLDRGVERLDSELEDQPQTRATLLHTIGSVYRALGRDRQADSVLTEAATIRRGLNPPDPADLADTLNELGRVSRNDARPDRAEAFYREALDLRRQAYGPEHVKVAQSLNNLGGVAFARGQMAVAEKYFRDAIEMSRRVGTPADVAGFQISLAAALSRLNRSPEAIDALREAIPVLQRTLGSDHTTTQGAVGNLARLLFWAGRDAEAESMQREMLRVRKKLLGPGHPDVATALYTLGDTVDRQGRHAEAEALERESVAIFETSGGGPNVDHAWALNALGSVLAHEGRYEESERAYRQALDIMRRAANVSADDPAVIWQNLGVMLYESRQLPKAEESFRRALEIRRGAPHVLVWMLPETETSLGLVLCERGSPEGKAFAEAGWKFQQDSDNVYDERDAQAAIAVGRCLVLERRFDEAQATLARAYETMAAKGSARRAEIHAAARSLASLYDAWGKPDEAARWRSKSTDRD